MGRLSGFNYKKVVKKLKAANFNFYRQAAGSHEIWYNYKTKRFTTIPNHPGDIPEGTFESYYQTSRNKYGRVFVTLKIFT